MVFINQMFYKNVPYILLAVTNGFARDKLKHITNSILTTAIKSGVVLLYEFLCSN